MVISFEGEVDDNIEFEFVGDAHVRGGCPATLNGQFFYFGSSSSIHKTKVSLLCSKQALRLQNLKSNKVSKIENCSMEIIGDMGFELTYGACNTFASESEEFVLLCFSRSTATMCHR